MYANSPVVDGVFTYAGPGRLDNPQVFQERAQNMGGVGN